MLADPDWQPLSPVQAADILSRLLFDGQRPWSRPIPIRGRATALPFYPTLRLVELTFTTVQGESVGLFALADDEQALLLDGTSEAIHRAHDSQGPELDADNLAEYVRLWCFAVRGDGAPFLLFEAPVAEGEAGALARPVRLTGRDDDGHYLVEVRMAFKGALFEAVLTVSPGGQILMQGDEPLQEGIPAEELPTLPELHPASFYRAALQSGMLPTPSGAGVLRTLVEVLLEEALSAHADHRLLSLFNARLTQSSALDRFSVFLRTASPIVALEGGFPFVEEVAADVLLDRGEMGPGLRRIRSRPDSGDDSLLQVEVPDEGGGLVLLSLHSYRGVADGERVAHGLAAGDVACLVGCDRVADLPDPLRRILDLTLRLPQLTPPLFERLFTRVLGSPPLKGWEADGGGHWVKFVVASDLQQAGQLRLDATQALEYIRGRVTDRLRAVDPVPGLSLSELHGLGEARQFATDLIAEIHEAMSGRLDWSEVDRGVLFVGPPGTGKTTLARAIAKECGVKFVQASAASWQASGHLGDHIRAIRADFARARRFAPSILFLDEIDSMGNREHFTGQNAQYNTETVNALLEQIQGMDPTAPVIVLAATNYEDRVDPALRRAGRLDRVIHIPYPNVEALGAIYGYYLTLHGSRVDPELDVSAAAGMSLGLSGADVELFVRGAARRARKARRPIRLEDLVAEITGSPRDPDTSLRLSEAELERVAVHEAGHALASFLGGSGGAEISYVSVIPRPDGTLGFMARTPSNRVLVTRSESLERIQVFLAGRAAEEVMFGPEGITGGAGGSATRSDLAGATASALSLVAQQGLGPDRSLLWAREPGQGHGEQAERILREAYAAILQKLREEEDALRRLARALVDRQELSGDEVREVLRGSGSGSGDAGSGAPAQGPQGRVSPDPAPAS